MKDLREEIRTLPNVFGKMVFKKPGRDGLEPLDT